MTKESNYAPYFDHLIHVAQSETLVSDAACIQKLLLIINEINILKVQGEDELRRIWFEVPRGNIDDYGKYEEFLEDEVVGSYEEFWSVFPEEGLTFQKQLTEEDVLILESIVKQSVGDEMDQVLNVMTAGIEVGC